MSKKNSLKQQPLEKQSNPTVSIVTITQLSRAKCLEILCDLIKRQTYTNITEWVITEGSKSAMDAEINKNLIEKLREKSSYPIVYVEYVEGTRLGALRNRGNSKCTGDITVCMDDDDYYFPTRVEHAVSKLVKSSALIAGCSALYSYDYILDKFFKFNEFGPTHSTNNCMAWKKQYLKENSCEPDKDFAEESSFTKNFSQQMVQLDADKTVIQSSHTFNTSSKRELFTGGIMGINPTLKESTVPINKFIPHDILSRYQDLFLNKDIVNSEYDITFFAGGFSILWDPIDTSLGGSESSIINLSTEWKKMGKKVIVYGNVVEREFNGVKYVDWRKFPFEQQHQTVILWRLFGFACAIHFPLKAKFVMLDLHDGNPNENILEPFKKYKNKIDKVMFKSEYQIEEFKEKLGRSTIDSKLSDKFFAVPNGIRVDNFLVNSDNVQRNKYRFCYCSCYTRGLVEILQYVWPIIYKHEPRAELHVYYGMNGIQDENYKNFLRQLLSQPGVCNHEKQPMNIIIREKYMSNFHLYISRSLAEIDCISIRESLVTGAVPLLSNFGVFKYRDGIHFENDGTEKAYQSNAIEILRLLRNDEMVESIRQNLKKSKTIVSWKDVAEIWLGEMNMF